MKPSEHRRVSIPPTLVFQRRTERLDWRRIASLDIEKLIQDGEPEQLEEFISPILFCKADAEFDEDRTDPGFVKVFRLSQLIGEYLLFCCDKEKESLKNCEAKCANLELEKGKFVDEITSLKESLVGAKKELKKRRDLLALTQTEAHGSNNQDEFDQCPYCPKRFLTLIYLQAHMQRRHQGLPMPFQHGNTINQTPFQQVFQQFQQHHQNQNNPKIGSTPATPTVYAFTMSPNGNVMENAANLMNTNANNIINNSSSLQSSDYNLHLQGRRESSTQTLITIDTIESEGEMRNEDQNGNIRIKNSTGTTLTESKTALLPPQTSQRSGSRDGVTVIKSPAGLMEHLQTHTNEYLAGNNGSDSSGGGGSGNGYHVSNIDLNTICDLVEKYLEQKSVASQNQHYDKILSSIQQSMDSRDQLSEGVPFAGDCATTTTNTTRFGEESVNLMTLGTSFRDNIVQGRKDAGAVLASTSSTSGIMPASRKTSTEMVEENVMRMKDEFEAQWRHLSEKVRDSGIQQLKGSFLTEIKKVQEIILKSPGVVTEMDEEGRSNNNLMGIVAVRRDRGVLEEEGEVKNDVRLEEEDKTIDKLDVEERLKRQEEMNMEQMKNTLQSKMQSELGILKSQLESQETFWRSKLLALEVEHKKEIEKLVPEAKSSQGNHMNNSDPNPSAQGDSSSSSSESVGSPSKLMMMNHPDDKTSIEESKMRDVINPLLPFRDAFLRDQSQHTAEGSSLKSNIQKFVLNPSNIEDHPDSNSNNKIVPVAKPRKIKSHVNPDSQNQSIFRGDVDASNNENAIRHVTIGSGFKDSSNQFTTGGGESRIVNQGYEMRLIPSDSEEPEYLTIIQPEEPAPINPNRKGKPIIPPTKAVMMSSRALRTGSEPQLHEYEEPLNVQNDSDQVSDYTFSASEEDDSDETYSHVGTDGEGGGRSRNNSLGTTKKNHHSAVNVNHAEALNSSNTRRKRNYIFDPKNGKLIEASGQKTQMDLVREKTVQEIDKQMEEMGINPEASTIGIDEMARALKHLKAGRIALDEDPELSKVQRDSLRREVNYETTQRSIYKKLDKYGALDTTDASPLAKMINKVKKSGSNWRTKVASAMKRKRKSPSNKSNSKKGISEAEPDLKTSFFSKSRWGRKNNKNCTKKSEESNSKSPKGKANNSLNIPGEDSNDDSEEEDSDQDDSSVDFEMPPFMTKSGPVLLKSDKRSTKNTEANKKIRNKNPVQDSDSESELSQEDVYEEEGKRRRLETKSQPQQQGAENVHQRSVINELKAKLGKHLDSEKSPSTRLLKPNPNSLTKSSSPGGIVKPEYKGPNFFVNASPSTSAGTVKKIASPFKNKTQSQVQVTSNGWSTIKPIPTPRAGGSSVVTDTNSTAATTNSFVDNNDLSFEAKNNRKKPFRRDLLEEFQQAESKPSQNNNNKFGGGKDPKNRNSDMPIVPEQEEESEMFSSSSGACCTSFEESKRNGKGNLKAFSHLRGHDEGSEDDEEDYNVDREIITGRERSQSFCRSDENRRGFRNRRSSCSQSDSDDGRPERGKRSTEGKGQYVSLRHPDTFVSSQPKHSAANTQFSKQGQRSPSQYSETQSDPTFHSSDTSIWETEDEIEDDRLKGQEVQSRQKLRKKSPRASGQEIENTISSRKLTPQSLQNYSVQPLNKSSRNPTKTMDQVHGNNNVKGNYSNPNTSNSKLRLGRTGTSRKSPSNNSWDSD